MDSPFTSRDTITDQGGKSDAYEESAPTWDGDVGRDGIMRDYFVSVLCVNLLVDSV